MQGFWRRRKERIHALRCLAATVIQSKWKAGLATRSYRAQKQAAGQIQRFWKGHRQYIHYHRVLQAIIKVFLPGCKIEETRVCCLDRPSLVPQCWTCKFPKLDSAVCNFMPEIPLASIPKAHQFITKVGVLAIAEDRKRKAGLPSCLACRCRVWSECNLFGETLSSSTLQL